MASMDSALPHFPPTPLELPDLQIRLLRILPGAENDILSLELHTTELPRARQFCAISYHWGSNVDTGRTLLVDGIEYAVHENCYYALWQTRIHAPPRSFVWVDALCINQDDDVEKSAQVRMMGIIYASADSVLACVGPHADGSELLYKSVVVEKLMEQMRFAGKYSAPRNVSLFADFRKASRAFSMRPYWSRRWILQELAYARRKYILCGTASYLWHLVVFCADMMWEASELKPTDSEAPTPLCLAARYAQLQANNLIKALSIFMNFQCSDPRDRIYSLLPLVQWSPNLPPVRPNYQQSLADLALELLPHCSVGELCLLLDGLRLTCRDAALQRLAGPGLEKSIIRLPHVSQRSQSPKTPLFRIRDGLDKLLMPFYLRFTMPSVDLPAPGPLTSQPLSPSTPLFYWNGKTLCKICADARPGDLIAPLIPSFAQDDRIPTHFRPYACLVLRPQENNTLSVVGESVLLIPYPHGIETADYRADLELDSVALLLLAVRATPCARDTGACRLHARTTNGDLHCGGRQFPSVVARNVVTLDGLQRPCTEVHDLYRHCPEAKDWDVA